MIDVQRIQDIVLKSKRSREGIDARSTFNPVDMAQLGSLVSREPATMVMERSSQNTCGTDGTASCEKPVSYSGTLLIPIVLGVTLPIIAILITLLLLHRRHVNRQRMEDATDRHASLDFGLGEVHRKRDGKNNTTVAGAEYGMEKDHVRQMSLEDMASPYLLPPELQQSRESLHSLSRTLESPEDPYRPVTQYLQDNASIRSGRLHNDAASTYTDSSESPSADLLSNAARMSRSDPLVPPPRKSSSPYPTNETPLLQIPAPVNRKAISGGLTSDQKPVPIGNLSPIITPQDEKRDEASSAPPASMSKSPEPVELQAPLGNFPARKSPPPSIALPPNPMQGRKPLPVAQQAVIETANEEEGSDYGDGVKVTPPSPTRNDEIRGQRYSIDVAPEAFAQAGLGAPGVDPRRVSMGFRPLPPNADNEAEDPELRANRIRSFYKEYFDDSKPAPQGQYIEDYDENYLGDAAYFDPDTNNFVMPYAEPVTRRAMTPPPRAPRFRGQGPPRAFHGSMGGGRAPMSPGPRAGSSVSNRMPPPGPRSYSSASGQPSPRGRPLPPPITLNSLPTPSKLRDDSFALMAATEFAPPISVRERQAGRSESPFGERLPYTPPTVPSFKPLAGAFDELAAMPSPHLLRKSGTFTALDFAPPRRFRDDGNASDAGSIRSNHSGISQKTNQAIRAGAYRVSRLPGDQVFTKDEMMAQLKPQWVMRQGSGRQ